MLPAQVDTLLIPVTCKRFPPLFVH